MSRLRILTVLDYYLPGWKAGGPIQSIQDMVAQLGSSFQFDILTGDRDLGEDRPFPGIATGRWLAVEGARVQYLSPRQRTFFGWARVLRRAEADVLYLNSFFSRSSIKILLLRKLGLAPRVPVVLAPRGELHPGALSLKSGRKATWLLVSRRLGLYRRVVWQASTTEEREDVLRAFSTRKGTPAPTVRVARQLSFRLDSQGDQPRAGAGERGQAADGASGKRPGYARVIFLSRISRKKNLDYALEVLQGVRGRVDFDIYGPVEDEKHWSECRALIEKLPASVSVHYRGVIAPADVTATFAQYHLFLFPTRGENFGRVVLESLLAGCPLLVSDQTPWRVAVAGAGWEAPLQQPRVFAAHLETMVGMDEASFARMSIDARAFGLRCATDDQGLQASRRLFLDAAAGLAP